MRILWRILTQYPDPESNWELSFRRALLYPFNYQGNKFSYFAGAKVRISERKTKYIWVFPSGSTFDEVKGTKKLRIKS